MFALKRSHFFHRRRVITYRHCANDNKHFHRSVLFHFMVLLKLSMSVPDRTNFIVATSSYALTLFMLSCLLLYGITAVSTFDIFVTRIEIKNLKITSK